MFQIQRRSDFMARRTDPDVSHELDQAGLRAHSNGEPASQARQDMSRCDAIPVPTHQTLPFRASPPQCMPHQEP